MRLFAAGEVPAQQTFDTPQSFEEYTKEAVTEPKSWIRFQANMTKAQALELRDFFVSRNIEFKPV